MDLVRSLTKYLPRGARRKIRKVVARRSVAREMAEHYEGQIVQYERQVVQANQGKKLAQEQLLIQTGEKVILEVIVQQKDEEIQELRAEIANFNDERARWYSDFQSAKNEMGRVIQVCKEYVVEVLTGSQSKIPPSERKPHWVSKTLINMIHNERAEKAELIEENKKLRVNHLKYMVDMICGYEKIEKVPVAVYHNGEMIYWTKAFERYAGSSDDIERELRESSDFSIAMDKNKRYTLKQKSGEVIFSPEKMMNNSLVAVAYFVPADLEEPKTGYFGRKHVGKRTKAFRNYGEQAVGAIYKTLKALDKKGMEFGNGKE